LISSTRIVLLAIWFGAALFFSVVVAPAAFGVLRSFALTNASEIAGAIVNRSLAVVNISGCAIGLLLLLTLWFPRRASTGRISFLLELLSLVVVTVATAVGHWFIAARIHALRAAMAIPIDQLPADDSRRLAFNSLHGYSVNALGLAMIAALVALVLMARGWRN
jgi:hypothetical protein